MVSDDFKVYIFFISIILIVLLIFYFGLRVAWRIIKDWIDSQLSLLEMQFAEAMEILLPYAYNPVKDKTMYQLFIDNKKEYLALEQQDDVDED